MQPAATGGGARRIGLQVRVAHLLGVHARQVHEVAGDIWIPELTVTRALSPIATIVDIGSLQPLTVAPIMVILMVLGAKAVARSSRARLTWLLLGVIGLAYAAIIVFSAHWEEARTAFEQAAATSLARGQDGDRTQAFEATQQLGLLHVWKEQPEQAAVVFGEAMVLDAWAVNYNEVIGYVGLENFLAEIERARAAVELAEGADSRSIPLLHWWTGFAQFGLGRMPAAEQSFVEVINSAPEFTSAWYYLFRSAYGQRDYETALMGLRTGWSQAPDELVALVSYDKTLNLAILDYLVGWLVNEEQQADGTRPREAAINMANLAVCRFRFHKFQVEFQACEVETIHRAVAGEAVTTGHRHRVRRGKC